MFTKEQVREWGAEHAFDNTRLIETFLRSKGLLVENKPLLADRGTVYISGTKTFEVGELAAHQAALDKVRDGIQLVIAWLRESGDHMRAAHLQDTFNAAVREGCWTPEAP